MGNAFARKQDGHWWSPPALHQSEESIVPSGYHCTDGVGCDAKDPVHAKLWDHMVDREPAFEPVSAITGLPAPLAAGIPGVGLDRFGHDVFAVGDWTLAHGGQIGLDIAGFFPGLNVLSEGVQSGYHAAHAANDHLMGDDDAAKEEAAEAAWHGTSAIVNLLTAEGGNEVRAAHKTASTAEHAAHTAHSAGEVAHAIHTVVDGHELAWDTASTIVRAVGGTKDQLPFLGALVPWISNFGGKEGK